MNWLILVTIVVPLIGGLLCLVLKKMLSRQNLNLLTGTVVLFTAFLTAALVIPGNSTLQLFELLPGIPVYFAVDEMGRIFAALTVSMWCCSTLFSFEYMKHQEKEERYSAFSLMSLAALLGVCFSGNLVTTYLFYEMMTLATFPLVMHEQTKEAIAAGMNYLYYSVAGAFLGLVGIFFIYVNAADSTRVGGKLAYQMGGFLKADLSGSESTVLLVVSFLMLLGLAAKAGMYPLHGWLPKAHPVAPAPASALLSGNITKMGILFTIRVIYYALGQAYLRNTWVEYTLLALATLTVLMGSAIAYREKVLKKRLAYSTVSQTSYVLVGVYMLHPVALVGGLMHVIFHSVIKNLLFLCAGAVIYNTGETRVDRIGGIGRKMPITMGCFTIAGLSLVGIPPTSAFISKWYLATGAMDRSISVFMYLVPAMLLVSALLTAGYLFTVSAQAFFVPRKEEEENGLSDEQENIPGYLPKSERVYSEVSWKMLVPLLVLSGLSLFLGLFPNVITDFCNGWINLLF